MKNRELVKKRNIHSFAVIDKVYDDLNKESNNKNALKEANIIRLAIEAAVHKKNKLNKETMDH
jgi:hypothetical protein